VNLKPVVESITKLRESEGDSMRGAEAILILVSGPIPDSEIEKLVESIFALKEKGCTMLSFVQIGNVQSATESLEKLAKALRAKEEAKGGGEPPENPWVDVTTWSMMKGLWLDELLPNSIIANAGRRETN
jgi:hypothetical protein